MALQVETNLGPSTADCAMVTQALVTSLRSLSQVINACLERRTVRRNYDNIVVTNCFLPLHHRPSQIRFDGRSGLSTSPPGVKFWSIRRFAMWNPTLSADSFWLCLTGKVPTGSKLYRQAAELIPVKTRFFASPVELVWQKQISAALREQC